MDCQDRKIGEARCFYDFAAVGRCAVLVAGLLVASAVGAQQETLGSILDQGAKKMPSADVRAAVATGMPKGIRPYPNAEDVTYTPDGTMTGYFSAYNVWATGSWVVDDQGRLCFDGYSGWITAVCYHWFKLGESIYILESLSDTDREQRVSKLN